MKAIIDSTSPFLQKAIPVYVSSRKELEIVGISSVNEDNDMVPEMHEDSGVQEVCNVRVYVETKGEKYLRWREYINKPKEIVIEGKREDVRKFCKEAAEYYESFLDKVKIPEGKIGVLQLDYAWESVGSVMKRKIENVYLPKEEKERIMKDIERFMSVEVKRKYKELGINHTRTYMLYGLPGTGKTTLIKAIASEMDKRLALIPMDREMTDMQLRRAFKKTPKNSIIVIEDIDCLFEGRQQNTNTTGVTFSGFLNVLDGVCSEDFVCFITTNKLKELDDALKRRIDYYLEFEYAKKEQIKEIYERFYGGNKDNGDKFEWYYSKIKNLKMTMNMMQKFYTKNMFEKIDTEEKIDEFMKFVKGELEMSEEKKPSMYM
jgi:SpoVK/Ycf46/Vps4 family AAA+-type ATPase